MRVVDLVASMKYVLNRILVTYLTKFRVNPGLSTSYKVK